MYQRLIEVCRQVGISLTFIKANLSARAPRISGGSVFRRNPTDTVKYIIPPPARRSLPHCRPVFLPLRPVNALPAAYLSLFSVELLIHRHVSNRHLVKQKKQAHSPVPGCVWVLDRHFSGTLTVVGQPISGPSWKKWKCSCLNWNFYTDGSVSLVVVGFSSARSRGWDWRTRRAATTVGREAFCLNDKLCDSVGEKSRDKREDR